MTPTRLARAALVCSLAFAGPVAAQSAPTRKAERGGGAVYRPSAAETDRPRASLIAARTCSGV